MPGLNLLAGMLLLLLGRRLFWLFVALVGFVVGLAIASRLLSEQPQWMVLLIGLGFGVIGALLAVFVQKLAIGLAGFLAGAYLMNVLIDTFNPGLGDVRWLVVLIGAVLAAVLLLAVFDWALIVISSLTGATLIVQSLEIEQVVRGVVLIVLLVIGVLVQARGLQTHRREL